MSADLGAVTYTAVTWTAGDVITEAKMDSMVANDQAYDSHSAQGVSLNNDKALAGALAGGTLINLWKINTDDEQVGGGLNSAWNLADQTWTYASASTITVPSGAVSRYSIGDSIRWKQGGDYKYGVLSAVADTLLTIIVNTDYVVTNAEITDNYYTHSPTAIGLPSYYNFTPTYNNLTVGAGTNVGKYKTVGRHIDLSASWAFGAGAAVGTDANLNFPVTLLFSQYHGTMVFYDVGGSPDFMLGTISSGAAGYFKYYGVSGTKITPLYVSASTPFTWTTGDQINISVSAFF